MNSTLAALTSAVLVISSTVAFAETDATSPGSATSSASSVMASCTIEALDAAARTIACGGKTYVVDAKTSLNLGLASRKFENLATGMAVEIQFHVAGTALISDVVTNFP
jgi:hypothetical protein